jgi:hypothetical protein
MRCSCQAAAASVNRPGVQREQQAQLLPLVVRHPGRGQAGERHRFHHRVVAGEDVAGCTRGDDGAGALAGIEHVQQRERQVFFRGQQAKPLLRAAGHARRVGTHEQRRDDPPAWPELGGIDRQVMAFEAPGPGLCATRPAEQRQVVEIRVAARRPGTAHRPFERLEGAFERHDAAREAGAALTQSGTHHFQRRCALPGIHRLQRQAAARLRHVGPHPATWIIEGEGGLRTLPVVERREERQCGRGCGGRAPGVGRGGGLGCRAASEAGSRMRWAGAGHGARLGRPAGRSGNVRPRVRAGHQDGGSSEHGERVQTGMRHDGLHGFLPRAGKDEPDCRPGTAFRPGATGGHQFAYFTAHP